MECNFNVFYKQKIWLSRIIFNSRFKFAAIYQLTKAGYDAKAFKDKQLYETIVAHRYLFSRVSGNSIQTDPTSAHETDPTSAV